MAARTLMFLKCPANLVFLRCLKDTKQSLKICQFSTCTILSIEEKPPVKFTTSPAAKVSIGETTGIHKPNLEEKFKKIIIISSITIFLIYFCILREENDVDEFLSGNPTSRPEELELIDLKIKLLYCEKNNLPTTKLKTRIEEIISKNKAPVFPK